MLPEEKIREFLESGDVLVDKYRLAIMLFLSLKRKARFKEIADGLQLSAGNLAHHLKILEERRYVKIDKPLSDLRTRIISITPDGYQALASFLAKLKGITI